MRTYLLITYTSLYILVGLAACTLVMMQISLFGLHTYASILFLPIWYALGDAITELFGIKIARYLIWMSILICMLYAILITVILYLPYPSDWSHHGDFHYVFSRIFGIIALSNIAIVIGGYINAFLIYRWKILVSGRFFLLRSIGASFTGELFHLIVSTTIIFWGLPFRKMMGVIASTYCIHLVLSIIYSVPNSFFVMLAKKHVKQASIDFNPFSGKGAS